MNEHFKHQAEQFMNAAKEAKIPEQVQVLATETVAKSREAFDQMAGTMKGQAKAVEELMLTTQAGAKTIGAKLVDNTMSNAQAAFDAAEAMAKCRSLAEFAQVQASFMQKQFAVAGAQTKEIVELSAGIARQAFESAGMAAAKPFDGAKKKAR
jgi:hypothetical protein